MSAQKGPKKKPYGKALVWGVVSVGMYAVLLSQQDLINENFTKGGVFAFLPVVTAFAFSIVHGNFTGNFWSVMGIEAAKKTRGAK